MGAHSTWAEVQVPCHLLIASAKADAMKYFCLSRRKTDCIRTPSPRLDNVFIERLWRSLKYEDIYLKGYVDGREARTGISLWMAFYNGRRPHQALGNRTPMAVWREGVACAACRGIDRMHRPNLAGRRCCDP